MQCKWACGKIAPSCRGQGILATFMQTNNNSSNTSTNSTGRNMGLLVAAQSLGGASPPIIISLGGLVGQQLSSDPTASTLPVSIYQLGLALSTLPAAWIMNRMGRRAAYALGGIPAAALGARTLLVLPEQTVDLALGFFFLAQGFGLVRAVDHAAAELLAFARAAGTVLAAIGHVDAGADAACQQGFVG